MAQSQSQFYCPSCNISFILLDQSPYPKGNATCDLDAHDIPLGEEFLHCCECNKDWCLKCLKHLHELSAAQHYNQAQTALQI